MLKLWVVAAMLAFLSILTPPLIHAQEEKAQEEEAPAAKSKAGGDTTEYNKLLEDWKGVMKELRRLRNEYSNAKGDDTKQLEEQWNQQIARGNELLPMLRSAAKEAYVEGGTADPQIQRFLLKLAQDAVDTDDHETAYDLAKTMLDRAETDKAPAPKSLYAIAGTSAFMTSQFEEAEKYFTLAKDAGALPKTAEEQAGKVEKYKELWANEKEIREQEAAQDDLPRVTLETTAGEMVVELFENEAPDTVGNFVSLVESGFYDNTVFHRVLPGFMAQGGDPKGTGSGGPGYQIYDELDKDNYRRHFRGTLSMAHAGKDTGGSQFFICFGPTDHLDGKHTAFGRVIEGLDVLAKIQKVNPESPTQVEKTKILSAKVMRKRDHNYQPRKVE